MAEDQHPQSLPSKVKASYEKLVSAASELNAASDRFAKLIVEINATLKPLNIGIPTFVQMGLRWSSDNARGYDEVGYAKESGKWGIVVRQVELSTTSDEVESAETWAFADGPRRLRLEAIEHLPKLLDELARKAEKETNDIAKRSGELELFVAVLKESAK